MGRLQDPCIYIIEKKNFIDGQNNLNSEIFAYKFFVIINEYISFFLLGRILKMKLV